VGLLISGWTGIDNLLVEIRWNGDNNINIPLFRTSEAIPRRLYAWNDTVSSGTLQNTSNYVRLKIVTLEVAEEGSNHLKTALGLNHPNPFQGRTTIQFSVSEPRHTTLRIYDSSGRGIRTLIDHPLNSGEYEVDWDSRDDNGREVEGGVYFYRLKSGNRVLMR